MEEGGGLLAQLLGVRGGGVGVRGSEREAAW